MHVYGTPEEFFVALDQQNTSHANDALVPSGQRICPICGMPMRAETSFGITVDVCPDHGTWLDKGELEEIIATARAITPAVRDELLEKAQRQGRLQGALIGWASLLIDKSDLAH